MEDDPPRQLVDQRVRNRLIELWELHASPEGQRRYQDAAPVNVFYELFEQWDDWVPEGNVRDHFGPPVFSGDEIQVMESYDSRVDDLWEAMPKTIDSIDTFCGTPQAATLRHEAEKALLVFKKRGRFDEEHLVDFNTEQDIRQHSDQGPRTAR